MTIVIYKLKGIVNSEIGMSSQIVIKKKISKVKKQFKERTEKFNAIFNNEDLRKIIIENKHKLAIKMELDEMEEDINEISNFCKKSRKDVTKKDFENKAFKNIRQLEKFALVIYFKLNKLFFHAESLIKKGYSVSDNGIRLNQFIYKKIMVTSLNRIWN